MLDVKDLNIEILSDGFKLVKNLSFTVNKGDKWVVIGHEGVGKSTLVKTLANEENVDFVKVKGHVELKGTIGYLAQDIKALWKEETVEAFLLKDKPSDVLDYSRYETLSFLPKILNKLGLSEASFDLNKTLSMYSGGESVKLGIAKLLLRDVDILLLDEPSNDLDFETVLFLERFIQEEERAIVYVSHDERLIENTATAVIHLMRVKKKTEALSNVKKMPYVEYKAAYLEHYFKTLQVAKKQRADHQKKLARFDKIFKGVEHQQNQAVRDPSKARLLAKKMKSLKATEKRLEKEAEHFLDIPEKEPDIALFFSQRAQVEKGRTVLDYRLKTLMRGTRMLSENIALFIKGDEKVVISGKNGVGKTTLLEEIHRYLLKQSNLRVGYMPQSYDSLEQNMSVLEFLNADKDTVYEARVRKCLGSLAFEREEMSGVTANLSGGQKAKLYLLKLVLEDAQVLLLDEPTRNLSPLSMPEIIKMLQAYKGAVLAISHDRAFIEAVFDRVLVLTDQGFVE